MDHITRRVQALTVADTQAESSSTALQHTSKGSSVVAMSSDLKTQIATLEQTHIELKKAEEKITLLLNWKNGEPLPVGISALPDEVSEQLRITVSQLLNLKSVETELFDIYENINSEIEKNRSELVSIKATTAAQRVRQKAILQKVSVLNTQLSQYFDEVTIEIRNCIMAQLTGGTGFKIGNLLIDSKQQRIEQSHDAKISLGETGTQLNIYLSKLHHHFAMCGADISIIEATLFVEEKDLTDPIVLGCSGNKKSIYFILNRLLKGSAEFPPFSINEIRAVCFWMCAVILDESFRNQIQRSLAESHLYRNKETKAGVRSLIIAFNNYQKTSTRKVIQDFAEKIAATHVYRWQREKNVLPEYYPPIVNTEMAHLDNIIDAKLLAGMTNFSNLIRKITICESVNLLNLISALKTYYKANKYDFVLHSRNVFDKLIESLESYAESNSTNKPANEQFLDEVLLSTLKEYEQYSRNEIGPWLLNRSSTERQKQYEDALLSLNRQRDELKDAIKKTQRDLMRHERSAVHAADKLLIDSLTAQSVTQQTYNQQEDRLVQSLVQAGIVTRTALERAFFRHVMSVKGLEKRLASDPQMLSRATSYYSRVDLLRALMLVSEQAQAQLPHISTHRLENEEFKHPDIAVFGLRFESATTRRPRTEVGHATVATVEPDAYSATGCTITHFYPVAR